MDIYLSSAYLAPVQYYTKFLDNHVFIEQNDNYIKQSYRNRCLIVSANGTMPLSIPVEHASGAKIKMKDVRIARHGNWQHLHWNAIVSAYNSTPFFEYYQDDFYPFYHKEYDFLFDFNGELLNLVLKLLNIDNYKISYTDQYKTTFNDCEFDLRESIHPKKDRNIADPYFLPRQYYQVFEQKLGFKANMSVIDLLFNMGNESIIVLMDSCVKGEI